MTDNEREEFVKPKCENCETLRPENVIKTDRDGKCIKCGKQFPLSMPPLNRVQITRRPREHYKALYFTARGRLWIACAVVACLLGYIIFKGAIK